MSAANSTDNVNSIFFDGHYKNVWRSFIPDELTKREIDFFFQYFNLSEKTRVLDMMCGYGRHSIALGRRGLYVTAVDNLADYIEEIEKTVITENLPVNSIKADILSYKPNQKFDLAICMGNSINFFNEEDSIRLMSTVAGSLVEGGYFLINSWSLAETVIKNFSGDRTWSFNDGHKLLSDPQYLFHPTRIETNYIMIDGSGKEEAKKAIDYIFSVSEMQKMLETAGLFLVEIFSIPGKKKFTVGEPRAYIIAQKKTN